MVQHINYIPLVRLLLPFVIGIVGASYLKPNTNFVLLSFGVISLLYFILLLLKKLNSNYQLRYIFGVVIYACLMLAGASLTGLKNNQKNTDNKLLKENSLFIGKIDSSPQIKAKSIKIIGRIKGVKTTKGWVAANKKVLIYMPSDSLAKELAIGDIISITTNFRDVPPPKNPHEFDYRKYLSYHLIHQQTFLKLNQWKLMKQAPAGGIFKFANDSRNYLINSLAQKGIKDHELAIAGALILGYKDNIDVHLKNAYSSARALHVLAVSGLHVGIIFLIFNQLFSFFKKVKYGAFIKGILLLLILWAYAVLTGLSPSVMRATTMFSFIVVANITENNTNFFNTLAASAFVLLIYNPLLIMEVGFQLSYMAVIGIVVIQPWINDWFEPNYWLPQKIWEITAVSIAAQIATFPLGLLYFHQFPNYFMLSNLIVIPLAVGILYLGIATLIFVQTPIVGDYLALGLNYLIKLLNHSVYFIETLPYALTKNIRFSVTDTWLFYLFIIGIICFIAYRKFSYFAWGSAAIIIFLSSTLLLHFSDLDQRKIIAYNIPQFSTINFIDGKENILLCDDKLASNRDKLLFHVQNNWIKSGVNTEKIVSLQHFQQAKNDSSAHQFSNTLFAKKNYFQFYSTKIGILNSNYKVVHHNQKMMLDILFITQNNSLSLVEILSQFSPKKIVVDASNSLRNAKRIKKEADKLNVKCWSVVLDGAFVQPV